MSGSTKKALFGGVTVVLILLLLELGSRLLGTVDYPPDPLIADRHQGWNHSRVYDPLLFWRLRPGSGPDGDTINSLGFRGPEIPDKAQGELRLLSLGESTTYGWKVSRAESYSGLLEQRLDAFGDALVINGGVPGYTLFQAAVLLETRGLELEPNIVLLYFGFNDFLKVAFREKRDSLADSTSAGMTDAQLFERRSRTGARLADRLLRYSSLARRLGAAISGPRRGTAPDSPAADVRIQGDRVRVPQADRWNALTRIDRLCRREGIDLVLVVPWYRDFEGHAPLLRRFAGEHGLTLVDLPSMLPPGGDYFTDPSHPGREGHAMIADEIWNVAGAGWRAKLEQRKP